MTKLSDAGPKVAFGVATPKTFSDWTARGDASQSVE